MATLAPNLLLFAKLAFLFKLEASCLLLNPACGTQNEKEQMDAQKGLALALPSLFIKGGQRKLFKAAPQSQLPLSTACQGACSR